MKPSNPMQQLQQWKANNGKSNKLKNELVKSAVKSANQPNSGLVKNTQGNVGSETKNKYQGKLYANPLSFKFAQLTRQFKLIVTNHLK